MENHTNKQTTKKDQGFLSADTVLRFQFLIIILLYSTTLKTFFK